MERYAHLRDITALSGFSIRLALAIILGFFVGLERQWTKHQAGILTNVIVCVGAYAYTAFSFVIHQDNTDPVSYTELRAHETKAQLVWGLLLA